MTCALEESVFVLHSPAGKSDIGLPEHDKTSIGRFEVAMRSVEGLEVERSSGNVFTDLGLQDADKLKRGSGLVIEIIRAIRCLGLTRQQAAERMRISQSQVTGLLEGDFAYLSEGELMDCLTRLDDNAGVAPPSRR